MGAGLVRDNLLQPKTGIRPTGPREGRVSRFARRLLARSRQGTVTRLCTLHIEAQRSKLRRRVPLCARTVFLKFSSSFDRAWRHRAFASLVNGMVRPIIQRRGLLLIVLSRRSLQEYVWT
jgi:hypothetical protein